MDPYSEMAYTLSGMSAEMCMEVIFIMNYVKSCTITAAICLSCRYDDPDRVLESEEFLPSGNGKKPTHFTDVRISY